MAERYFEGVGRRKASSARVRVDKRYRRIHSEW